MWYMTSRRVLLDSLTRGSKQWRKVMSEMVSPWKTQRWLAKASVFQSGVDTNAWSLEYTSLRYCMTGGGSWMWVSMSWVSWWLIDLKALARSRKVMWKEHCMLLAFSIMAVMEAISSTTLFMPVMKPFWAEMSMVEFCLRLDSGREARMSW